VQCVAVCCNVLQRVACSVLQCVAVCCNSSYKQCYNHERKDESVVLQSVAVLCCIVWQCVAVCATTSVRMTVLFCGVLQCYVVHGLNTRET